jgi:hypothetical protein
MTSKAVLRREVEALTMESRLKEVARFARRLELQQPDWLSFFREIFGVEGAVRRLFPLPEQVEAFDRSEASAEILAIMNRLRAQNIPTPPEAKEPTRMITVRLPASIHESLLSEARLRGVSMNHLCIAKLVQLIDSEATAAPRASDDPTAG